MKYVEELTNPKIQPAPVWSCSWLLIVVILLLGVIVVLLVVFVMSIESPNSTGQDRFAPVIFACDQPL